MAYWGIFRQFAVNAVFWVGLAAMLFTVWVGDFSLVLLFVGLLAVNILLLFLIKTLAPNIFRQLTGAGQPRQGAAEGKNIGFRIYPLNYPKVLDEEGRDFVPELIHVDIQTDAGQVFRGNFKRDALKQFRDSLSQVLTAKEARAAAAPVATIQPAAKKPAAKKRAKKK